MKLVIGEVKWPPVNPPIGAECQTCDWKRLALRIKLIMLADAHLRSYRNHIVIISFADGSQRTVKNDTITPSDGDKPPF